MMDDNTHDHLVYEASRKSTGVAYFLWFFFGGLGVHRFYLGRKGTGIAQILLLLSIVGIIPLLFWWLVDGVKMPEMVQDENIKLIQEMQAHGRRVAPPEAGDPRLSAPREGLKPSLDPRVEEIRAMRRR